MLARPSHGEEYSPFQSLNQGDLISLSFQDSSIPKVRGTLYDIDQFEITVALDGPPPMEQPPTGRCQLDVLGSEATYKRMKKALVNVQHAQKNKLAHLLAIFIGPIP